MSNKTKYLVYNILDWGLSVGGSAGVILYNYITPDNTSLKADLILIATKNNTIGEVLKNIENFVKQDTIILSLLNGLQS